MVVVPAMYWVSASDSFKVISTGHEAENAAYGTLLLILGRVESDCQRIYLRVGGVGIVVRFPVCLGTGNL